MTERRHQGHEQAYIAENAAGGYGRFLQTILDGTPDAMFIKDPAGCYRLCNASAARLIGRPSEDIIGRDDFALFPRTAAESICEQDRQVMTEGKTLRFEETLAMRDGESRTFHTTKGPMFDQLGRVCGLFGIARDMTEQKQEERAFREAQTAVELAMEGISKLDETGRYLFVNQQYAALLGYSQEELIGQSWKVTVHPDDQAAVLESFARMLAIGRADAEIRGVRKDGSIIHKQVVIVKPDTPEGKMAGHYCFVRDITERKIAQDNERAAQRLLAAITRVQSLFIDSEKPEAVFDVMLQELLHLTESEYGFVGEVRSGEGPSVLTTYAITNVAWNDETRELWTRLAPTLEFQNLKTLFGRVMTSCQPVITNDPANDPRGGGLPPGHPPLHAFLGLPFFNGGVMTGMVGVANRPGGYDESLVAYLQPFLGTCAQLVEGYRSKRLRNETEDALRQSQERWQLAAKGTNDGIWDWNIATKKVFYSSRWAEMRGYAAHEVTDTEEIWRASIHPDDLTPVMDRLNAYFAKQSPEFREEYRVRRKDGSYMWILDRGVAVWDEQGRPIRMAGSDSDITERKQAEALQEAEKQTLELVAQGRSLNEVLAFLCHAVEDHTVPMLCSVMLANQQGTQLSSAAAPSLPEEYNRLVDGIPIGPTIGSCGSAAYFGRPAIVADISSDPLWTDYAHVALAHGLKACWSQPILSSTGAILGTFAAYCRESREPKPYDLKVVERASRIAALAIEHARVVEALRESEARFQAFMAYSPTVEFIKDEAGRHLFINSQFEQLFGVSRAEVRDKTVFDFMPREIATRLHENDQLVFSSGQVLEVEEAVPDSNGRLRYWLVIKFPIETGQGRLLGGTAIDITARKAMESLVAEQKEQLRLFIEHSPVALAMLDRNLRYLAVSQRWRVDYHLGDQPLIGRSHYEVFPEIPERWKAIHRRCLAGAVEGCEEDPFVRLDGQTDWSRWEIRPWLTSGGGVGGIVIFSEDITARKQAEDRARESEARFRTIADTAPALIWMAGPDKKCTYFNQRWLTYTGRTLEQELGDGWAVGVHPDDLDRCLNIYSEAFDRREPFEMEYRLRTVDGRYGWIHDSGVPRLLTDGTFAGYLGACIDISERKRAEEKLSCTQFAMDQAVDAVYWIDSQARILYTNEAATAMLGYTADEFLTMTVHDLNPDFPKRRWPGWWEETRERKVISLETVHLAKDGRRIPIDSRVSFLAYGGQEFHCAFVRDITERKQAEEEQHRMRMLLTNVISTTPDLVSVKDQRLRTVICNEVFAGAVGKAPAELIGHTDVENGWDPEVVHGNPDKGIRGCEQDDREALSGKTVHNTNDLAIIEGVRRTFDTFKVPLRNASGEIVGVLSISRDVTERKRMEDALDALARGTGAVIGHEFFPVFVKELAQALQVCCAGICDIFQDRPGYAKVRAMWNGGELVPPFEYALAPTPCGQVVREGFAYFQSSVRELFPEDADLVTLRAESYLGFLLRSGSGEPMGHIFMIDDKPLVDSKQAMAIMQIFAARAAAELERIRVDDALRASQERFELAVLASNDGIWDWNILTGEQYWSHRHFKLFGLEPQAFAPTYETWISLLHPDDAGRVRHATQRHLDAREPYDIEVRVRMKDGGFRWFHDRGQAVWDRSGRPIRMVGSVSDVTERKAAHAQLEQHVAERTAALHRSEQRYAALVNSVDGIIMEFDPAAARITFVSQQAERIVGYPLGAWIDEPSFFDDHLHPDDRERVLTYSAGMTKQGLNHEMEYRMLGSDGRIVWIRDLVSLMHADDDTVKLCCILMDVTKQKEIGNRLQLTQFTVDRAAQGIFWVGPNAEILYVNEAACSVLGYSRAELLSMTVHDIDPNFPPEIWPSHWEELKQRGSFTFESSQLTKDGKVRYTEITVNYLEYDGREYNCANVRDITERKTAEDAVRDSELRYKLLTEATFDGIAIHDQGILLEVNSGLERMFGYDPGELIGRPLWDLVAEDSRDLVTSNMRSGVTGPYEATGLRKDGTTFPGEVVVRPCRYRGKDVRLVAGRDITERKRLEVQLARHTEELERQVAERTTEISRLVAQRAQVEKLAAMGQLAAGVAHEINNPIAGIRNAFQLVKQAVDPAHPHYEFVGMIDREISRMAAIVQNMYLLYKKQQSRTSEFVHLPLLLRDLQELLAKPLAQRNLAFTVDVPDALATSLVVPQGDLFQVLLNFTQNAIDSSPPGGRIAVTVTKESEGIRIAVSDEGSGIAPDVLPHIFDPFYTTKTEREQKGMGLGLSISQSLVQAMGGSIQVETHPNRGSRFSILLPKQMSTADAQKSIQSNKEAMTHDR